MGDQLFTAPAAVGPAADAAAPVWELSGWWRRVGATVIDYLVVWFPIMFLISLVGVGAEATLSDGALPKELDGVSWLFMLIAGSIYFMITMSAWNGQTVGKRVTGIRVVRENGEPVDATYAFLRQTLVIAILFNSIAIMFLFIPTVLNYLWPLWDENHQALHDKIVKSRVVRAYPASDPGSFMAAEQQPTPEPAAAAPPAAPPAPAPPAPPVPGGTSTPYTPPPGFENPVPDEDD